MAQQETYGNWRGPRPGISSLPTNISLVTFPISRPASPDSFEDDYDDVSTGGSDRAPPAKGVYLLAGLLKDPDPKFPNSDPKFPDSDPNIRNFQSFTPKFPDSNPNSRDSHPKFPNSEANFQESEPNFCDLNPKYPNLNPNFPDSNPKFPDSNPNSRDSHPKFPNSEANFQESEPNFCDLNPKYPNSNPNFPDPNPKFPDSNPNFRDLHPKFPNLEPNFGDPNPKSPNLNPNFPDLNAKFPNSEANFHDPDPKSPNLNPNFPDSKCPNLGGASSESGGDLGDPQSRRRSRNLGNWALAALALLGLGALGWAHGTERQQRSALRAELELLKWNFSGIWNSALQELLQIQQSQEGPISSTAQPCQALPDPHSCPQGWIFFHPHCYWFSERSLSWDGANASCQALGAHLAVVSSEEEQLFLKSNIHENNSYWLGVTDKEQEGKWRWVTGESPNFGFWDVWTRSGEPERRGCGALSAAGFWVRQRCQRRLRWVCERPWRCQPHRAPENTEK